MKIKYYLIMLLASLSFSCSEDLGNYNYTDLNQINISNLKDTSVVYYDRLTLNPTLSQSMFTDTANLEYLWYIYLDKQIGRADTLAHTRILDTIITSYPAKYNAVFKVTDKTTGVYTRHSFILDIQSGDFAQGLMILYKNGENGNLAMATSSNKFFPKVPIETELTKPYKITQYNRTPAMSKAQYYWIMCHDGNTGGPVLDIQNLANAGITSSFFFAIEPSYWIPEYYNYDHGVYGSIGQLKHCFMLNNGRLYSHSASVGGAKQTEVSGEYEAAPFIFHGVGGNPPIYSFTGIYDNKKKCFGFVNKAYQYQHAADKEHAIFNQGNVGLDMIFAEEAYSSTWLSVCRGDNDRYVLSFKLAASGVTPQNKFALSTVENGNNAVSFTSYKKNNHLYYAAANKVYCLDVAASAPSIMGTPLSFDHPVTFVKFHTGTTSTDKDILWIVTTRQDNGNLYSKVHICTVKGAGIIEKTNETPEIQGEIVDLFYKK